MIETHYTYKITDPKTNEYYIGVRTSKDCIPEEDDYMGSMVSWNPEDRSRLRKEILGIYPTREIANSFERKLQIIALKVQEDEKCMNAYIYTLGFHTYGMKHSIESRNKMSKTKKKLYMGDGNPFYGKSHTDETKRKISKANTGNDGYWLGKTFSDSHIKKLSEVNKGKFVSHETKERISKSLTGRSRKKETKEKIRNTLTGRKRPKWHFKSISKGVVCLESGDEFSSIHDAARECGLTVGAVSYHCNGKAKNQKFKFI